MIRPGIAGQGKAPYVGVQSGTGDGTVKVNDLDTAQEFLEDKLIAGTNITLSTVDTGGGDLAIQIDATDTDTNDKVGVSAADTTPNYLNSKISVSGSISKSILNPGANEQLQLSATDTNDKTKVSAADTTADYLNSKIAAGTGITKTILNPGANEQLQLSASLPEYWTVWVDSSCFASEGASGQVIRDYSYPNSTGAPIADQRIDEMLFEIGTYDRLHLHFGLPDFADFADLRLRIKPIYFINENIAGDYADVNTYWRMMRPSDNMSTTAYGAVVAQQWPRRSQYDLGGGTAGSQVGSFSIPYANISGTKAVGSIVNSVWVRNGAGSGTWSSDFIIVGLWVQFKTNWANSIAWAV